MTGRSILLTFANERFRKGQELLARSARLAGFDEVICASPDDWRGSAFAERHRDTLAQPRGCGYWLWKPWLIQRELKRLGPDDILFYSDASIDGYYRFSRFPKCLVSLVRGGEHGFVVGPLLRQHGPVSRWTKRDALVLMNADRPEVSSRPTVQATWSLWRKTASSLDLLEKWLAASSDPRILTDMANTQGLPNHPDFVDHRHDQSILSILVHRDNLPVLDLSHTGIFEAMARRPNSEMTHRFLKAPRNVEKLLAGKPALPAFATELVKAAVMRRVFRQRTAHIP